MLPVASQMPSSSATSPAQTLRDDAGRTARCFAARGGAQRRKARSLAGARANQSKSRILMARLPCVWTKRSRKKQKSTRIEVLWGRRFALSSACLSPRNPRKQSESGARGEAASVETERQARIAEGKKSHCGREEKTKKRTRERSVAAIGSPPPSSFSPRRGRSLSSSCPCAKLHRSPNLQPPDFHLWDS